VLLAIKTARVNRQNTGLGRKLFLCFTHRAEVKGGGDDLKNFTGGCGYFYVM